MANVTPATIAEARKAGYSDAEIASHLSQAEPAKFKAAADAGYSPKEVLDHLAGVKTDAAVASDEPSGVVAGFKQGLASTIAGGGKTRQVFMGGDNTPENVAASVVAPDNYKRAEFFPKDSRYLDPRTYNWKAVPQILAEAAPGLTQDIAAARIGAPVGAAIGALGGPLAPATVPLGGAIGGIGAGLASWLYRTRGDAAKTNAEARTGNPDAEPEQTDKTRSLLTGAAEAPLQALNVGRFLKGANAVKTVGAQGVADSLKKLGITAGVGGANSGAQDAIEQVGSTVGTPGGVQYDPNRTAEAAAGGALASGALAGPRAATDVHTSVKLRNFGGDNTAAAAIVAGKMRAAVGDGNLTNTTQAKSAVDAVTHDIHSDLSAAVDATGPVNQQVDHILERATSPSTMHTVTEKDIATVARDTAGGPTGPQLTDLVRQAKVASMIPGLGETSGGKFTGGIASAVASKVGLLNNPVKTAAYTGAGLAGAHVLGMFNPHVVGGLAAGYGVARMIDSMTGSRSPAAQFADRMSNSSVTAPAPAAPPQAPPVNRVGPTGPSVPMPQASPWGSPAPYVAPTAPTGPSPQQLKMQMSALLASRKAASMQQNMQNKQTITNALPMLQTLAARNQVPPAPVAPPIAPTAAPPVGIPSNVASNISDFMRNMQKGQALKQKYATAEPAGAPVEPTPAQVAPSVAPAEPLILKITKSDGNVQQKVKPEQAPPKAEESTYTPVKVDPNDRGLSDKEYAQQELSREQAAGKAIKYENKYLENTVASRAERRRAMADAIGDHPEADQAHADDLLQQLHKLRRRSQALEAIDHYTSKMSPEAAQSVRERFSKKFVFNTWPK